MAKKQTNNIIFRSKYKGFCFSWFFGNFDFPQNEAEYLPAPWGLRLFYI